MRDLSVKTLLGSATDERLGIAPRIVCRASAQNFFDFCAPAFAPSLQVDLGEDNQQLVRNSPVSSSFAIDVEQRQQVVS
jgi:hypothetical protein